MRIFDCFAFFNELDLLEIRLNELDSVVDKFVLVESTKSFQKKPKPLYFNENKERFKKFLPKIEHVIVDHFPTFFYRWRIPRAWEYDDHQKNQVAIALKKCKAEKDDVIIYSDLDEIPNPVKILEYKDMPGFKIFEQKHFYYFLNCVEIEPSDPTKYKFWYGSVMGFYRDFKNVYKFRLQRDRDLFPKNIVIPNSGWHFAYLGGVERIIQKIESYAHTEHNVDSFKDPERIRKIIESCQSLYDTDMKCKFEEIDSSFPKYLVENKSSFLQHIK